MLEVKGNYIDYKILSNGNFEVSFEVDKKDRQRLFSGIDKIKDQDLDIKIAKHREKRSLDANGYFWVMCGKLADKLNKTNIELYKDYIRDYGCYRTIQVNNNAVNTITAIWKSKGVGWIVEKVDERYGFTTLNIYYGSSTFSTKQMSRLIDGLVQDCKAQGIETLTPKELEEIINNWEPKRLLNGKS